MSEGKSAVSTAPTPGSIFPLLPAAHNFSVLGNPARFQAYIAAELPMVHDQATGGLPMRPPPLPTEKLRRNVNSTFLNGLLKVPNKVIHGTLEWVERDVFGDIKLPVAFDFTTIQKDEKLWNSQALTICRPPASMSEKHVQIWLNNLASNLAVNHKLTTMSVARSDRGFDSRTSTKGPLGGYMLRKPDICVINRADQHDTAQTQEQRLHWRKVYAFIEVTGNQSSPLSNVLRQITQKAACIFDVQPQRRFVCAVGIFGEPTKLQFIFVVVDRAGMTHTLPTELKSYAVATFLRIIFAFCYAEANTLGWDPTMRIDPETHEVTGITITGCEHNSTTPTTRTFDVIKLLHSSPILYSRGTRVWIVKDQKGFYVLKDSWILAADVVSEIEFIKHIGKTVEEETDGYLFKYSCPTYVIGEECVCSTDTIRGLLPDKPSARHQRRVVTATIGDPITSFRSKKELVSIYLDLVNALEFLNVKAKVIHGDLSINNILINRVWNHEPNNSPSHLRCLASNLDDPNNSISQSESVPDVRPVKQVTPSRVCTNADCGGVFEPIESAGMIIDCDFMRYTDQNTHQTSGTLPFIAIEALVPALNNQFKHHAGHDLESLLSTLFAICHYTIGPSGQLREAVAGDENIKLNEWFTTAGRLQLATVKSITLEAFKTFIIPALPNYWVDFAPFLYRLIQATWKNMPFLESPNVATHQAYRDVLKEALAYYTREETNPPGVYAFVPKAKRPYEGDQPLRRSKRLRQLEGGSPSELSLLPRSPNSHFLESYMQSIEEPALEDDNF